LIRLILLKAKINDYINLGVRDATYPTTIKISKIRQLKAGLLAFNAGPSRIFKPWPNAGFFAELY
jgi:hypothetical protein